MILNDLEDIKGHTLIYISICE